MKKIIHIVRQKKHTSKVETLKSLEEEEVC